MSGGHESHGHGSESHASSGGGGSKFDFGISAMIAGFFSVASGTGAMKEYMEGKGGGGGHGHH